MTDCVEACTPLEVLRRLQREAATMAASRRHAVPAPPPPDAPPPAIAPLLGPPLRLERGQRAFHAGAPLEALYVIRRGSLKSVAPEGDGGERIAALHLPGELLGLDALGEARHRCHAEALEPVEACALPMAALPALLLAHPPLQAALLQAIGRAVANDQAHMETIARRQAHERLAHFLLGLHVRGVDPGAPLALGLRRREVAEYLGLVIETVSRAFTRLRDEGLIEVRGRAVRVLDAEGLRACADGLSPRPRAAGGPASPSSRAPRTRSARRA